MVLKTQCSWTALVFICWNLNKIQCKVKCVVLIQIKNILNCIKSCKKPNVVIEISLTLITAGFPSLLLLMYHLHVVRERCSRTEPAVIMDG